jgi:hypothetical protein
MRYHQTLRATFQATLRLSHLITLRSNLHTLILRYVDHRLMLHRRPVHQQLDRVIPEEPQSIRQSLHHQLG